MSENTKKILIMAVCVVCLTMALISSILMPKTQFSVKSILKNIKNESNVTQNNMVETIKHIDVLPLKKQSRGAVVIEQSSKRVLYDEGMNEKCYPASTTKVLTALCVLENLPLDKIITVPKEAEGVEGSSIYLKEGQKISVKDLLLGLMLRSGNDAAVTLAVATSGNIRNFANLMNETAKRCGAYGSNFVNPHGLHDEMHYTTAYDLALICAKAYENEDFCKIVSTSKAKITVDDEARYIGNKNKLLHLYDGANGVKTGFTKKSGRCLVSGAKRSGMQVVGVVLNHSDMWNDTIRMLDFAFDNYYMCPLDEAMLTSGENEIRVKAKQNVTGNWQDLGYPLKRDGSERLIVESC